MKYNSNAELEINVVGLGESSEKYSLRHRQKRPTRNSTKRSESSTKAGNNSSTIEPISLEASSVPLTSPLSTASSSLSSSPPAKGKKGKEKTKTKQKAAPLSKYRRKTANARERIRMREINSAFEHLRKCVPVSISDATPTTSNEKLTKITTLRLAMKYISTLNNMLNSSSSSMVTDSETSSLLNNIINKNTIDANPISNNNNNNLAVNNNNTDIDQLSAPIAKGKRKSNKSEAAANKKISKRRTAKTKTTPNTTTTTTTASKTSRSRSSKKPEIYDAKTDAISAVCLTPPPSSIDSPINLGLMLESDGESLHLSEPCLSPPLSSGGQLIKPFGCSISSPPSSMTTSHDLDIGLFLESDTDSLHFPEPCLSPLVGGFDALSPFGDLLHSSFAEHSSLDIYLT